MAVTFSNSTFINLPISSLKKSVDFFSELGFEFNAQFTSEDTTCMLLGPNSYAMLLEKKRFSEFIDKDIASPNTTEVLIALMFDSRDSINALCEKAFSMGARNYKEAVDLGFMYQWGFEDVDGHIWELGWMDPAHILPS